MARADGSSREGLNVSSVKDAEKRSLKDNNLEWKSEVRIFFKIFKKKKHTHIKGDRIKPSEFI